MLKLIMKIERSDELKNGIVLTTQNQKGGCVYFRELDEAISLELLELGFDKKERKTTRGLSSLQTLIEKSFNLILYEKDLSYGLNIYMTPKGKGNVLLTSITAPKQSGVAKVFDNAEIWASDLIRQFNRDRENTL